MWQPGTAKPSSPIESSGKQNESEGTGGQGVTNGHSSGTSPPQPSSTDTAKPQKKALSGATMNMRFMQRKKEQQKFERKHQRKEDTASSKEDTMDIDDGESSSTSTSSNDDFVHSQQQTEDEVIASGPATTVDMYGISVEVIGRRSFGGFNRAVEETWKSSYRSHREGTYKNKSISERVSDEELLKRYANLVKDRRGDGDNSRSPIGNLSNKGQRNKSGSGQKRKRR